MANCGPLAIIADHIRLIRTGADAAPRQTLEIQLDVGSDHIELTLTAVATQTTINLSSENIRSSFATGSYAAASVKTPGELIARFTVDDPAQPLMPDS